MSVVRRSAVLVYAIVANIALLWAQSGPPTGLDLSGTWTLDTYLSDGPAQVAGAVRGDFGQPTGEIAPSGRGMEGGRRGGGEPREGDRGRGGSRGDRSGRNEQANLEAQNRLNDVTAPLRYPPTPLTIKQTATAVTFTDQQGRERTLTTNGKREKLTFESLTLDTTSRWEGPLLVSEQDLGKGQKMTFTYSIVPTTKQLLVRITIERAPNQPGPFEIRQVYNKQ
jgi:hypothetical protein